MRILFISLLDFSSYDERSIYTDLIRCLIDAGHDVYSISPIERRRGMPSYVITDGATHIVKPCIGNIQKTGIIEKGISTLLLNSQLKRAVKLYFTDVKFDLVLYPTPPISFLGAVEYVKERDGAFTYLMLKDIFPQNAVEMGMLRTRGPMGLIWKYFRRQEQHLYRISDIIGCMSPANIQFLLSHNPDVNPKHVTLCPNSVIPRDMSCDKDVKKKLRRKYGLPENRVLFVFGGNLGVGQGIPFLVNCLRTKVGDGKAHFLIVGDGTEYEKLEKYFREEQPHNATLIKRLPKEDFDTLVGSCDVGLILLDHRFTIPNFPSRTLSYLQARVPILCATDDSTDIGKIAEENGFGISCSSADVEEFNLAVDRMISADRGAMGEAGWDYLCQNWDARKVASEILDSLKSLHA